MKKIMNGVFILRHNPRMERMNFISKFVKDAN